MRGDIVEAGHPSRCGVCDEMIHEGDEIIVVDGEWVHAQHVYDEDERRTEEEDYPYGY